jgi:drug/metabolite transporter (DMT)-like permease
MLWLLLSVLSSTAIFVIFKLLSNYKVPVINVIVINYFIASLLGGLVNGNFSINNIIHAPWLLAGIVIGVLFMLNFVLIGISSNKVGISITTVASKMSVAIPMVFSIIYYNELLSFIKIAGLVLAIIAVLLAVLRKTDSQKSWLMIIIPAVLFFGMGLTDGILKYAQHAYVSDSEASMFTSALFFISFLCGVLALIGRKKSLKAFTSPRVLVAGIVLGIVNFGSIFFIILALNSNAFQSSIVFGLANIGVVTFSVLAGILFFKEKLTKINTIGVSLAVVAILLLFIA